MLQREVRLIFGQTGSGKTWRGAQHFKTLPRAIVAECDFGEFEGRRFNEYPDLVVYLDSLRAFENPYVPFRVSYSPRLNEYPLIFETALELGNCWLFLEELDRFGDPADIPAYAEVITRGRHYGINIEGMATHPFNCPVDLRRQCTSLVSYRQMEPRDVKWIYDLVGPVANDLPRLRGPGEGERPPFPYLEWDGANGARIIDNGKIQDLNKAVIRPPHDGQHAPDINSGHGKS